MKLDFWHQRWLNKEIGWHRDDVHPLLDNIGESFFTKGSCIFVPLCGKSLDMVWLAEKGYEVIGSELSEIAVEDFFKEQRLQATIRLVDGFKLYEAGVYKIYQGNFFDLKADYLSACEYYYDRAAVVALPENMRSDYVKKIQQLFKKGSKSLLISLSYLSETRQGPPFSLQPNEIKNLWKDAESVTLLESSAAGLSKGKGAGQLPKFKPTNVEEHAFEIIL